MGKQAEAQAQMGNAAELGAYKPLAPAPRISTVWLRESVQFETATLDRLTAEEFAKPEAFAGQRPVLRGLSLDFDKWGIIARYEDKMGQGHTVLLPMAQVRKVELAE